MKEFQVILRVSSSEADATPGTVGAEVVKVLESYGLGVESMAARSVERGMVGPTEWLRSNQHDQPR